ncbi:YrdB family protein [Niallia oryzisoli]|uniref:YrdB family protein n=1 Tax=Niallia oryzisoli TaxID=1737571 RepID=A0ABZ2C7E6_9BACI
MILKNINLVIRFLIELCALASLGYWGFITGKGIVAKFFLGIGAPVILAVIWGAFGSPKAAVKLSLPFHLLLELIIFGIPALALYAAGKPQLAWIYGFCVVLNRTFMFIWKQ